jgi:hypothetical protein
MNITSVTKHIDEDGEILYMCVIDEKIICVPDNSNNRHYAEIMRQVEAGELTIADADPIEE